MDVQFLTPDDLVPFRPDLDRDQAEALISDATAWAQVVAPCIADADFPYSAAVKAILRGAIVRWLDAGSGGLSSRQQSAGSFQVTTSYDNRTERHGLFWPSEISALEDLCRVYGQRAFTIDTTPYWGEDNPLEGAVINADDDHEPQGEWSPHRLPPGLWVR